MPADPDATAARHEAGALVESPPVESDGSTSQLDDFFNRGDSKKPLERKDLVASKPPRDDVQVSTARSGPPMQARKVHRLVRNIEAWSVLKISLIFFFCIWVILLTSAVILWKVASSSGVVDNVESFIEEIFALDSFKFEAGQMFRAYAVGGLVMVVAASGFSVLLAVLFNLISDLTGGIRVSVVEEESAQFIEADSRAPNRALPDVAPRP